MVNLSNLNVSRMPSIDLSNFTNGTHLAQNMAGSADNATQGWYSIVVGLILFLFLLYEFYKENGLFRLDFLRAALASSSFVFVIMSTLLLAELITSIIPTVWSGFVILICGVGLYYQKKKGL